MPVWIIRLLRKYWKVLLIVAIVGATYFYFQNTASGWAKRYSEIQSSHQTELKQIEKAHQAERKAHEENLKTLQSEMDTIRRNYDEQIKQLSTKKRAIVKQIIEDHGDKPDELADELSKVTGFRVQKASETK